MNNTRTAARIVGALMLAAFLLYGVGSSIAIAAAQGPMLTTGVLMMLLNSVAVVAIGALMLPILRPHTPVVAVGYLATRIFEGAFLAVGAICLLVGFARANFLAYWGFVGYACFAAGCILELAGVAGAGLISTIPGGLFELFFAVWLIARGFSAPVVVTVAARA